MFLESFPTAKDYMDDLCARALKSRASDLHFENRGEQGIIRVRVEGTLVEWARLPLDRMTLLIRRIKFICGLDPERSGFAGEGRFEYDHKDQKIVMRVSVLPTAGSDDIVVRILGSSPDAFGLKELNFHPEIRDKLIDCVHKSMGLMVVTGPTGSGKTSTLYAAVQEINDGTRKIITVEDPIEYKVTGLSQIKLDPRHNVTYSRALHGVLRHDPDVILIGECRDLDAAEIAIEASMTGHLVLTTMHTNNAVAAVLRLMNIGISAIDVSNSLTASYAQRLIPRLCPDCKEKIDVPAAMAKQMSVKAPKHVYRAKGCDKCNGTGYKGRLPVAEILMIDDDIRDVIIASPSLSALNKIARDRGMRTMMDYGLEFVAAGELQYVDVVQSVT